MLLISAYLNRRIFAFIPFTFLLELVIPATCVDHSGLIPSEVVTVTFVIEILDVSRINIENMDFRLDFNIRLDWTDEMVNTSDPVFSFTPDKFHFIMDDGNVDDFVWTPDFFLPNSRFGPQQQLAVTTSKVVLFSNRTISYSARLWAQLGCQMEFQWYPMDVQGCELAIESFSFTAERVRFMWDEKNPVIMSENIKLLRYAIRFPLPFRNDSHRRFGEDDFSRIELLFVFERQIGHHLIQTYTSTFLVVSLSWFSFWLGMDAIPGRVSLLITSMLTLVTMFVGSNKDIPPVTYVKMMDIWMIACMSFVFTAIGEFIIVKHMYDLAHPTEEDTPAGAQANTIAAVRSPFQEFRPENDFIMTKTGLLSHLMPKRTWRSYFAYSESAMAIQPETLENWERLDRTSRILFPLSFFLFISVYVPILVFGSQGQRKNVIENWV